MLRSLTAAPAALVLAAVVLSACTTAPADDPPSTAATTTSESSGEPGSAASLVDAHGVLTEAAVTEAGPDWGGSIFVGDIQALPGNVYSDECLDSAWSVLSLFEAVFDSSTTFQADSGAPAPALTLGVLEMTQADQDRDLAALTHQLTECVGERPDGEPVQQPAPAVAGWSGLHVLGDDDRDVYWAPYETGIVIVQLAPGSTTLGDDLVEQAHAIMALQLEQVS